jgi:uncharacterized protein with NRDE domain
VRGVVCGRDPFAGGTWLGINADGLLVAITNRLKSQLPAAPRSRGLLVLDLLQCASALAAMDLAARELSSNRYAGCNIVCADTANLFVLHAGDWLRVRPMPPGLHVLTTHDINDESDPRLGHAFWWLSQRSYGRASDCVASLQELCAQTGNSDPPMCLRGKKSGTISSSIVTLREPMSEGGYLHAQGPPDRTPYQNYAHLLQQLSR